MLKNAKGDNITSMKKTINQIVNLKNLSPDDFNISARLEDHPKINEEIFQKCEKNIVDLCIDKFKDLLE